ncbi:MAG: uracil-DNA glycosylase [Bacteroidales bacterium]
MLTCPDAPRTLRFKMEREERMRMLDSDEHIAPLTAFVRDIRHERRLPDAVPFFDPCDGGTRARALFLLDCPGDAARHSGFVSRNNPDDTAETLFELQEEASLPRADVAIWNAVPWHVAVNGGKWKLGRGDAEHAQAYLSRLIALLARLQAVVIVGRRAQSVVGEVPVPAGVRLFESPHCSPVAMRTRPGTRDEVLAVWSEVAAFLGLYPWNPVA